MIYLISLGKAPCLPANVLGGRLEVDSKRIRDSRERKLRFLFQQHQNLDPTVIRNSLYDPFQMSGPAFHFSLVPSPRALF